MKLNVENREIARILGEIADILELKNENPFRIRSYRNAARIIEDLSENISDIVAEGKRDLKEIPGVGKGIASKILEIVQTGDCEEHRALLAEMPASLVELLRLPGLGPKKVSLLHQELHVETLAALEAAARAHKIRQLPGMGEKTEAKILQGIEDYKRSRGRVLLWEATPIADQLLSYMKKLRQIHDIEIAGSFRRRKETVGDLDMLVTCHDRPAVMEHFLRFPKIKEVLAKGDTKSSVRLTSDVQVDLRVVEEASFGAALVYFTGSKAHNIAIRDVAKKRRLKINEYGVYKVTGDKEKKIAGRTEEEVYQAIGLPWIPPEIREDRGELSVAQEGRLPKLIEAEDIKGDLHMHTYASDGQNSILEMAEAAQRRGLSYIAITDHSKSTRVANGLDEKRLLKHIKEIDKVNQQLEGIQVLKGLECDIKADGRLDLDDEVLAQLDVVVIAVHSHMGMSRAEMTERVIKAFSHARAHIFAHPSGRILKRREPYQIDMERIMAAALEYRVALELDSYPTRLDLSDVYCKMAKDRGVKLTIDTDSHMTDHLQNLQYGIYVARRGWLEKQDVLNTLPVDSFLRSLRNW